MKHNIVVSYFAALDALCGELVFVTFGAVDVVFLRDKGLGSNWVFARNTNKTFLMPLPGLVFHLLHT